MQQVNNISPSTYYVQFDGQSPRYFAVYDKDSNLYHFRFTDGNFNKMKFNIPDTGIFYFNCPCNVIKVCAIETPVFYPTLPPAQRSRWKDAIISYNANLSDTPAICYSNTGHIEVSPLFMSLPKQMQEFIIWHEKGHFLYVTEEYCDLFALINYCREGYNRSVAYYTMYFILNHTQGNIDRLETLFNQIQKMQDNEL